MYTSMWASLKNNGKIFLQKMNALNVYYENNQIKIQDCTF